MTVSTLKHLLMHSDITKENEQIDDITLEIEINLHFIAIIIIILLMLMSATAVIPYPVAYTYVVQLCLSLIMNEFLRFFQKFENIFAFMLKCSCQIQSALI